MTTTHAAAAISAEERKRRREAVDDSIHSLEMEGLAVSDRQLANLDDFVAGVIEMDELLARTRAPYLRG